jgi:hypothetical protein
MTMAMPCNVCTSITSLSDIGMGTDSEQLKSSIDNVIGGFERTQTIGSKDQMRNDLARVFVEYSSQDWDGEGALPISKDAYFETLRFIKGLPTYLDLPLPVISPDNDGEISLEWYRDNRHVLVVSISGKNSIAYAGLFGANKTYGTEYFAESLPAIILINLRRLYS